MHFTGIHTDFLGAKVGACITSAYGKSDSKWPLKSVCDIYLWLEIYKESNRSNSSSTYINFVNAAWIANQMYWSVVLRIKHITIFKEKVLKDFWKNYCKVNKFSQFLVF